MADRFPLIVNAVSKKIEEIVAGDNLELTGNGIVISGDSGAGKYLTSNGTTVSWGTPGDVYLTQAQTLTNKTIESSIISGSLNTITNLPNTALINSGISINGVTIPLGGTVITPDDNTTYSISAQDGLSASQKIIRLTSGGNAGAGVDDDITFAVGVPASIPANRKALSLFLDRSGDTILLTGLQEDDNTVTTLQAATGGSPVSGPVTIAAGSFTNVSQTGGTITITGQDTDTITRLRATTGQPYNDGDFTFLAGGSTSVAQGVDGNGDPTITYSSTDTVTRLRGGITGTFTPATTAGADITITGGSGGQVTVSQSGNTISIDSQNDDTITRLASGAGGTLSAGDFRFVQAGATTITTSTSNNVTTFTISSANDDTGASLNASGGLILQGTNFRMKNYNTFSGNTVMKWDSGNAQLTDSIITDNGSTVTIGGDLVVTGTQTILETQTLIVEDNDIELRKGTNLVGTNGGITLNRTSDSAGNITSSIALQWFESGGYWRSWDGSVDNRFVTETETQVLTNKTLTAPTLTAPILGTATATSINGLEISSTASAVLDIASSKTLDVNRDLVLTSDNNAASVSVNFRQGGNVAYTSDTLATFASTTSTQMRGLVTDTTGTGRLMFNDSPTVLTSLNTTSTGFTLLNSGVTNVTAFGAAGIITMGLAGGTTTINQNLVVNEDLTVGATISDTITFNGIVNSENADIRIRGGQTDPMEIGRGGGSVNTNTRIGASALASNTSGSQNTAVGYKALQINNAGASNTAVGNRALQQNGVGNNNVALGKDALLVNTDGSGNLALGNSSMETNTNGDFNVCIGHYAGYDVQGNYNVLIGPAYNQNSGDVTFRPPSLSGDSQLVIGSGGQAWIKGDSAFNVTFNNDVIVDVDLTVKGNLNVLGTQTVTESNIIRIADKNIELAYAVSRQFVATCVTGSPNITGITPTAGLIPGMEVTTGTTGITIPAGTIIQSISNNTAVLSNNITGSGQVTIDAIGLSDSSAEDGGMIVKGSTDKTILWKGTDGGVTYNTWVSSENFDLASGKILTLNGINIADPTAQTIGPVDGTGNDDVNLSGSGTPFTLGSAVKNSSLTSVGTLTGLAVSGTAGIYGAARANTSLNVSMDSNSTNGLRVDSTVAGTDTGGALNVYNSSGSRTVLVQATGAATFNDTVTTPFLTASNSDAASADTALFRNTTSGGDNRVRINVFANGGGDPYIKFDAGGSNMIVGEQYNGTTLNQLLMGVGESPSSGVTGFGVDGNGKTWSGTHVDGNGQFTIRNNAASRYTIFELSGNSLTNYKMIKAAGKYLTRGTAERNIDIVSSLDEGTNINQMVQVSFYLNSAVNNNAGKITFQAGCHRSSGGNYTFWSTTPQLTNINGSGYGAGTVSWVGGGTNVKTLRYVTDSNINYTNYMIDIIVTGYDNANFAVL